MGHLALGYLSGKATSRLLNAKVNIPLLFLASVIPDLDILIPGLEHRGPTHSLITLSLLSVPALTLYGKRAAPYLVAVAQHSLVGDYLVGGGVQILWPLTTYPYSIGMEMAGLANVTIEWTLFLIFFALMLKTRDAHTLLQPHPSNLLLSIPVFTVLLPPFFHFPIQVPMTLIIPHLTLIAIFTLPILKDLASNLRPYRAFAIC